MDEDKSNQEELMVIDQIYDDKAVWITNEWYRTEYVEQKVLKQQKKERKLNIYQ